MTKKFSEKDWEVYFKKMKKQTLTNYIGKSIGFVLTWCLILGLVFLGLAFVKWSWGLIW